MDTLMPLYVLAAIIIPIVIWSDAKNVGMSPVWGIASFLTFPLGPIVYVIARLIAVTGKRRSQEWEEAQRQRQAAEHQRQQEAKKRADEEAAAQAAAREEAERAALRESYSSQDHDSLRASERALIAEQEDAAEALRKAEEEAADRYEWVQQQMEAEAEGWDMTEYWDSHQVRTRDEAKQRLSRINEHLAIVVDVLRDAGVTPAKAEGLSAVPTEYGSFERRITVTIDVQGSSSSFPLTLEMQSWRPDSTGAPLNGVVRSVRTEATEPGDYRLKADLPDAEGQQAIGNASDSSTGWPVSFDVVLRDGSTDLFRSPSYSVTSTVIASSGVPEQVSG